MALIEINDLNNSQSKVFYYKQELKSDEFNRVFSKTLPTGIYEGGDFTYIDENSFSIAPFSVVIADRDSTKDIAVRIRTTGVLAATIENSISFPLIVARFEWTTGVESSLQIIQVSENEGSGNAELNENDLILGKLNLKEVGGVVSLLNSDTPFDYTRKSWSPFRKDILRNTLFVRAPLSTEDQNKVYLIESGPVRTRTGLKQVSNFSSVFTNTVAARTDYVYIDDNGDLLVQEGTSSTAPPYFGRKVIAEIRRGPNRNNIIGSDIFNVVDIPIGSQNAETFLIKKASPYFTGTNITIEDALSQVWQKAVRQIFDEGSLKIFRNASGIQIDAGSTKDSIVLKASDTGSSSRSFTIQTPVSALAANRTLQLPDANVTLVEGTMVTTSKVNQTIAGIKTFSEIPRVVGGSPEATLTPVHEAELTPKKYVDILDTSFKNHEGSSLSTENAIHGVKAGHDSAGSGIGFIDSDKLDGQHGSYYRNAGNINAGILSSDRLSGTYNITVTTAGTCTGNAATATKLAGVNSINGNTSYHAPSGGNLFLQTRVASTSNSDGTTYYLTFGGENVTGNKDLKFNERLFFVPSSGTLTTKILSLTSSREKKKDIIDYQGKAIDIINSSRIVSYKFKDDETEATHIGIIAEEAPDELVTPDHKTFAIGDTIGLLLKAVQELSDKIEKLEKKVGDK